MKRPKDMTEAELRALPEVGWFSYETYTADESGIVTLPDGRTLKARRGDTIRVPRPTLGYCVQALKDDDIAFFWVDGVGYTPVQTEDGWAKRRVCL